MASLSKMSVRGIRSFSPDRDETIQFYSPLTMIVGANGCGKTSIIECLKCSVTGALPPNARGGRSFINDPSMTDSAEVKANIKLRFMNKLGKATVVVRSFQLTKKKNKMEYKALEGVVRSATEKGDKTSSSHKCTDLDKIVPELLGVSAPIMENVLFCHQEENTWPLEEGAILKKKFDDIFESTRYTKALDAILKAKKDVSARAKDLKTEVAELGAHLLGANEMRDRLESCNERQSICERDIDSTVDRIQGIESKIQRYQDTIRKYASSQKEIQELQWKIAETERRVQEKSEGLEQELEGTDAELDALVNDFDGNMVSKRNEYISMQRTVATLEQELSVLRSRNDELQSRRGEAKSLKAQVDSSQAILLDLMAKLATKYVIRKPGSKSTASSTESVLIGAKEFFKQIENSFLIVKQKSESTLVETRETAASFDKESLNSRLHLNKCQIELSSKNKEIEKICTERETVMTEIAQSGPRRGNKSALDDAKTELDERTSVFDDFARTYDSKMNAIRGQVKTYADRIRDVSTAITDDDEVLFSMSANRAEQERSAALDKQLRLDDENCRDEAQNLLRKYRDAVGVSPVPNNTEDLQPILDQLKSSITHLNDDIARHRVTLKANVVEAHREDADVAQYTKRSKELTQKLAQLRILEGELTECVTELNTSLRGHDDGKQVSVHDGYDHILQECKAHETLLLEYSMGYISSNLWLNKLSKKATKNIPRGYHSVCPCCERGMNMTEQEVFAVNLRKIFKATKEQEVEAQAAHEAMRKLCLRIEAVVSKLGPGEDYKNELNEINSRLPALHAHRESLQTAEAELEGLIKSCEARSNMLKTCQVELGSVRGRWEEVQVRREDFLSRRARQSQSLLTVDAGGRTYMEIEQIQRTRKAEKEDLSKKKEAMQAEESQLMKVYFKMKQDVSDCEKRYSELKSREVRISTLEARLLEIDQLEKILSEERLKLNQRLSAAERDVRDKQESADRAKQQVREAEGNTSSTLLSLNTDRETYRSAVEHLEEQYEKAGAVSLSNIEERLAEIHEDMATKEVVIKDYAPKMQVLSAEMSSQERTKRIVVDNISLRQIKAEEIVLRDQYEELNARVSTGVGSYKDTQRDLQRAEQDKQKLSTEHAMSVGRLEELKDQQKSLEKQLNSETYKNIDARHRKKNIEYETTMMAVTDLDSYFHALDGALMNFHIIKIREVNKIVKELWQAIYRGEDIDTIEIVSGEEGESCGVSAKRSYNYRVVMRKGDSPLEMRGRCSAGQCMLAGIVIRLALAESFCLSCGILALDEPTTNLDEPNKAGLAHALARLIASRSNQQNFQLLCITHDEDFVGMMRTELSAMSSFSLPEYYFRISRQEEGSTGKFFSRIERIPWEDM